MKNNILIFVIVSSSLQAFAADCSVLTKLIGTWTSNLANIKLIVTGDQEDYVCHKNSVNFKIDSSGFRIDECSLEECEIPNGPKTTGFNCNTAMKALKIKGDKIYYSLGGVDEEIGSCFADSIHIKRNQKNPKNFEGWIAPQVEWTIKLNGNVVNFEHTNADPGIQKVKVVTTLTQSSG